jgi:hypothetical protein
VVTAVIEATAAMSVEASWRALAAGACCREAAAAPAPAEPERVLAPRQSLRATDAPHTAVHAQSAHARRDTRRARRPALHAAGIPALDCVLKHASTQPEAGGNRKVECELAAVAFGDPRGRWRTCRREPRFAAGLSRRAATAPASRLRCTSTNSRH